MQLLLPNSSLSMSSSPSSPDSLVGDNWRLLLPWWREDWLELLLILDVPRLAVLVVHLSPWSGEGITAPNRSKDWTMVVTILGMSAVIKSDFLLFLLGSSLAACMLSLLACCNRRLWNWSLLSGDRLPRNTLGGFILNTLGDLLPTPSPWHISSLKLLMVTCSCQLPNYTAHVTAHVHIFLLMSQLFLLVPPFMINFLMLLTLSPLTWFKGI